MIKLLYIFLGSGIGGTLRYASGEMIKNFLPSNLFFIATILINITGSFIIGFAAKYINLEIAKYFVIIGLCGGFTTFSSFSLENLQLINSHNYILAILNIVLSITLCIAATYIGFIIKKSIY